MRIFNEDDLLDDDFRASIIGEIDGPENRQRRDAMFARYEVLRDRVKHYVLNHLSKEMDPGTVEEMSSRVSNINLYKKVISKKSRVYQTAPVRELENEAQEDAFGDMIKKIKLNTTMKKANNYLEAFKNSVVYVRPYQDYRESGKWRYELKVLPPHLYDVIEDSENPERGRVYILSAHEDHVQYNERLLPFHSDVGKSSHDFRAGDGKKQIIADSPGDNDEPQREFVVWSDKYHFTINEKGDIIQSKSPGDLLNPIGRLPFVDISRDKDGSFWALGGEDLFDGTILVNALLTDMYFIQKIQGMGIFYMFGKNVPKAYKLGPNRAITMKLEDGDPSPQIGFASSNPPIDQHMSSIEQYVAFLLTTNDLGTNAVGAKLDGQKAESGIHELVMNSEPMNAIEDDQELFRDAEPEIVNIATLWHNYYLDKNALVKDLAALGKLPGFDYFLKYSKPQQMLTDKEKIEQIEKKMNLKLMDRVQAMVELDPDMSKDDAIEVVRQMEERRLKQIQGVIRGSVTGESKEDDKDEVADMATNNENKDDESLEMASGQGRENIQKVSLNGAQVSSLLEIVEQYKSGLLDKDSAMATITAAFPISKDNAARIVGKKGTAEIQKALREQN